jgi:hypothetical protein
MFTSRPGEHAPAWATQGDTLEDLASKIGVDGAGLVATVDRFNADVRKGPTTSSAAAVARWAQA